MTGIEFRTDDGNVTMGDVPFLGMDGVVPMLSRWGVSLDGDMVDTGSLSAGFEVRSGDTFVFVVEVDE